jgi:hypothetical protein
MRREEQYAYHLILPADHSKINITYHYLDYSYALKPLHSLEGNTHRITQCHMQETQNLNLNLQHLLY